MSTTLNALVAGEHAADLRRAAELYNSGSSEVATSPMAATLRMAEADDVRALRVLAELDEEPELSGGVLLAEVGGEVVSAISLEDGRVVANPFVATRGAVALLKLRAEHLSSVKARQPRRRWRPHFA